MFPPRSHSGDRFRDITRLVPVHAFWSTPSRRVLTVALAALSIWVFAFKAAERMPDFEVYWRAGTRAMAAGPLYRVDDGHFAFKYLPAFAVLAAPVGLLPQRIAKAIWFAASVFLLVALLPMAVKLLPERRKPAWALYLIVIVALGKFYGHEIVLGQVNLLLAVISTGALRAIKSGREPLAGGLIVLAIVIKPYAAIFLPWLVARGRLPSIATAAAGIAIVLALPAVLYGWSGNIVQHQAWWNMVTSTTTPNLLNVDNVSLSSVWARIFGTGETATGFAIATSLLLLAIAGVVMLLRRRVTFPDGLEGGMLLTLIPLLSPQGWDYVFLLSTPAIVYLANYEDRLPGALRAATIMAIAAIGLSIFDLMGRAAYRTFMEASMITWLFLVVIAALVALRAGKVA